MTHARRTAGRKLKARKRRHLTGKPVRLSNELLRYLAPRIKDLRSYDAYFRRVFGLPDWQGRPQTLVEGCLEVGSGQFFLKEAAWDEVEARANGAAVVAKVKLRLTKVPKPIRMREIA